MFKVQKNELTEESFRFQVSGSIAQYVISIEQQRGEIALVALTGSAFTVQEIPELFLNEKAPSPKKGKVAST